jgi:mRNA interferase MazF
VLRGEVFWADLEPAVGHEANKVRPVVIVSNNGANAAALRHAGVVTVVPLTSSSSPAHPFQALVTVDRSPSLENAESKAQAEQVRSISTHRIQDRLGFLSASDMRRVDDALRVHLRLD